MEATDWKQGDYVWAKTNSRYWPAVVVNAIDGTMQKPKEGFVCVFWFGDNRISMVSVKCLLPFGTHFKAKYDLCKKTMGKKWQHGILTAIREFGRPSTSGMGDEELLEFAESNFENLTNSADTSPSEKDLPKYIQHELNTKKYVEWRRKNLFKNTEQFKSIANTDDLQTLICVSCYRRKPSHQHPILHAKICTDCSDKLKATLNVLDDEGCYIFCMICSNANNLTSCLNERCKRRYCRSCVRNLLNIACLPKDEFFCCILCRSNTNLYKNSRIKKRKNWIYQLQTFLSESIEIGKIEPILLEDLKILMFFCGSSVGLNLVCPSAEKLFHSNSNEDFLGFSYLMDFIAPYNSTNLLAVYPENDQDINSIILLDKTKFINASTLQQIGQLDLILGGTSHDPIIAHKFEENATLVVFYEFYRILQMYKWMHNSSEFFWLFETSCFIPMDHRNVVSRYLESAPMLFIENDLVRLIWTNLPATKVKF